MNRENSFPSALIKPLLIILVTALHILIIVFAGVTIKTNISNQGEPVAGVMKLVDVEEQPPPSPEELPDTPFTNTLDSIAETMVATDDTPPPAILSSGSGTTDGSGSGGHEYIEYLPQHKITKVPVLPEDHIKRAMVYPPIAQRSNIEGMVYLELFIDRTGAVRNVRILRENPPDRGFGDAALRAFRGIKGIPAEANGEPVAVRYRYNLNFKLN